MKLGIYLPTYKRPHTLADVAKNIEETTFSDFVLYFGCEPDDKESIDAARKTGHKVVINKYDGDAGYSNTIQSIYEESSEPIFFHANDDFIFLKDWDKIPMSMFKTEWVQMVGVPQNEQDRTYSAICFTRRSYIKERSGVIDMPNRVFYPYHHNYQDTEFTYTAQARGVWASSDAPCIIHQHPGIVGGDKDETYRKNDATVGQDEITFNSRKHLWQDLKEG